MKKLIIPFVMIALLGLSLSSCNRNCGGGWYGDRNLTSAPTKKQDLKVIKAIPTKEIDCSTISNP